MLIGGSADFTVDVHSKANLGKSLWYNNKSKGNGKPQKGKGTLYLKTTSPLGTAIHEIGHLLGLSQEQDHSKNRKNWYKYVPDKANWLYDGAVKRACFNCDYGDYDKDSVMLYPKTHYGKMTAPSAGDIAAVKAINGW